MTKERVKRDVKVSSGTGDDSSLAEAMFLGAQTLAGLVGAELMSPFPHTEHFPRGQI